MMSIERAKHDDRLIRIGDVMTSPDGAEFQLAFLEPATSTPNRIALPMELNEAEYASLIGLSSQHSEEFSVVWREQCPSPMADRWIEILRPWLLHEGRVASWPGTTLLDTFAMIRRYRLCPETESIIRAVPGLYAWLYPNYPEDLAFYTKDGACWFYSITHERQAFIEPDALEATRRAEVACYSRECGWMG